MNVLLADDDPRVCQALRMLIEEEPGFMIVGEVSDAEALLSQALALLPDVILLKWELSAWPGNKLLRALKAVDLPVRVIVLSSRPQSEGPALAAGADGFVGKTNGAETLLAVLRRSLNGEETLLALGNEPRDVPGDG